MDELTPRERRQQRTRQAILDAARQIISKQGIDALSIRAIADATDYSPAGLYEYFGSKEEIVAEVCAEGFRRFTSYLKQADTRLPAAEYMAAMGKAYIDFALKNPDFYLLMFTTAPLAQMMFEAEDKPSLQSLLLEDSSFGILLRGVQRCLDEGVIQAKPGYGLLEMAYGIWAQTHGIAMLRIAGLGQQMPFDFDEIDRITLQTFFNGLRKS